MRTKTDRRGRPGPYRALVVLGLLAGLFGMHGINADHALAMSGMAQGVTLHDTGGHARNPPPENGSPQAHGGTTAPVPQPVAQTAAPLSTSTSTSTVDAAHAAKTGMGAVCVAVLGASLVLLLAAAHHQARRDAGTHQPRLAAMRPAATRAEPPAWRLQPSLTQLCILRT